MVNQGMSFLISTFRHMLRVLVRIASQRRFSRVPTTNDSMQKCGRGFLRYVCYSTSSEVTEKGLSLTGAATHKSILEMTTRKGKKKELSFSYITCLAQLISIPLQKYYQNFSEGQRISQRKHYLEVMTVQPMALGVVILETHLLDLIYIPSKDHQNISRLNEL